MYRYVTPYSIGVLRRNQIIVIGSHKNGLQGEGPLGQTYAIPVIGGKVTLKTIERSIGRFTKFASEHPKLTFYVTEIGRGCKKYPPYMIAMMFFEASKLPNVYLPSLYWDELEFGKEIELCLKLDRL